MSTFDDVFDEVVSKTKSVASKVGQKTSDFIDVTKLKIDKSDVEREITSIYEGIGRLVYDSKKSGEDVTELVEGCIEKLNERHFELEDIKKKIDDMRNVLRCTECGAGNDLKALFCNHCGSVLKN